MKSIKCNQISSTNCTFVASGGHVEKVKKQILDHYAATHLQEQKRASKDPKRFQNEIKLKIDSIIMRS